MRLSLVENPKSIRFSAGFFLLRNFGHIAKLSRGILWKWNLEMVGEFLEKWNLEMVVEFWKNEKWVEFVDINFEIVMLILREYTWEKIRSEKYRKWDYSLQNFLFKFLSTKIFIQKSSSQLFFQIFFLLSFSSKIPLQNFSLVFFFQNFPLRIVPLEIFTLRNFPINFFNSKFF